MYLGDYTEDYAKLNFTFTSRALTGIPTVLAGSPVVSVYKGSGTTPKTSAESYITLGIDFASKVGLNKVLIDLSGNAFFVTGEDYHVVITTGTVDSVSVVGETVATFSIENRRGVVATDIVSNGAIITLSGSVFTVTNNSDMRGTDSASTHSAANVWSAATRVLTANTNLNDPTAATIAAAVMASVVEGTTTVLQFMRLTAAAMYGKLSGAATATVTIRDEADGKDRITATVDEDGNRTAVTLDKS